MKKILIMGAALLGVSTAWATVLSDDFNRTDTALVRDASIPGTIGADWVGGDPLNYIQIDDNELDSQMTNGDGVFYNVGLGTSNTGGESFTLSIDVKGNPDSNNGHWIGGAAFNVQDGDNWYGIRYKSESQHLQFVKSVGGAISVTGSVFGSLPNPSFLEDTYYTITVSSSTAGVFDIDVRETGSSTAIFNGTVTDPWAGGGVLAGGYGGIYAVENGVLPNGDQKQSFDNYSLETGVPYTPGTDDFNRPDSGMGTDGSTVGPDWHSSRTTGQWGIVNERVVVDMVEPESVLYNDALQTVSGNGTNFTVSLDVMALQNSSWAGMAFNYQDADNFYFFRYKGGYANYQMYRVVNGSTQSLLSKSLTSTSFSLNTDYTLTVSSSDPYVFNYEIKETAGGSLLASGVVVDGTLSFTGGYAGIFQTTTGSGRNSFDNFSVVLGSAVSTPENYNLFVQDDMVTNLQAKVATPEFSDEWIRFIARADRLCNPASWEYADPGNVTEDYEISAHTVPRRLIYWMQTLGLAYRLTGNTTYRDHGALLLVNSAQQLTINSIYMAAAQQFEGGKGDLMRGLATGYDFFADHLTPLERAQVLQTSQTYLDDYLVDAQNPLTSWRPYHNYSGVNGGAAGLVSLQLRDIDPVSAAAALPQILLLIEDWLETGFDNQGAYSEGVLYSVYGLETVVLLADVLKRDGGEDLFVHSTLHNVLEFYFQSTLPGEKVLDARNDSNYQNPGEILLKLASEYGNGAAEWLYEPNRSVDEYNSWGPGHSFFLQVLWDSDTAPVSPEAVGTPLGEYFEGRGLSTWRTGWATDDVMFAVEAGKYFNVTHDQADEGHFTLYGYGYDWACDVGYANNRDPGSKAQTVAHNCVLIDGVGQAPSGAGIGTTGQTLEYKDTPIYGYALMDCSDAYRRYYSFDAQDRLTNPDGVPNEHMDLDHAYRHSLFIRETATTPAYAVVFDNISKDGNPHDYRWQMLSESALHYSALSGSTATVAPQGGSPARMFVFLDAEASVTLSQDTYDYNISSWLRLKANCTAVNPYFSAVLVPSGSGISPTVTFSNTPLDRIIHVEWPGKTDRIIWRKDAITNAVQILHGEPGYAAWAGGWGVDIGADTADYDLDGVINVHEFGLGGNPTNSADLGTLPEYVITDEAGSNVLRCVHPQLADPESGLDYYLELSTNLVSGAWVNAGYVVTGTNVTGNDLNFVTNTTGMVEQEKFIRLIIE